MKLQLGKTASDIVIATYLTITLLARFIIEPQLNNRKLTLLIWLKIVRNLN